MSEMLNENVGQEVQTTTTEQQPFRVFKTQKEFDDFSAHLIKKTEDKALKNATVTDGATTFNAKEYEAKVRKDLEAKIRADIERQAQMSEAERLAEERAKMEADFREQRIEINKEKARNLLTNAGFEDDEMDVYLDFVTEDRDVSLGKIMRICESRRANKERLHKQWQSELLATNPNINIGGQDGNNLQAQYDNAKSMGNLALMSNITRKASQAGIPLRT